MKTSEQGLKLIVEREGCRLEAYLDSVGVPTIGVGHTAGVHMGMTITQEEAAALLREDLKWCEAAVNNGISVPLEQHQFDALVSFVFNVGQGAFMASTLRRVINSGGDDGAVAAQFDRWHIPAEITSRRNGERDQFRGAQISGARMSWLSALPWLIAAFGVVAGGGGTLWYRGQYESCVAARAEDRALAEKARADAIDQARIKSDAIIQEQAAALAATANKAGTYVEKIIHVPVTTACSASPAMRAASAGVRDIIGSPGGGAPAAGGGAPAAVRGPGAGGKP